MAILLLFFILFFFVAIYVINKKFIHSLILTALTFSFVLLILNETLSLLKGINHISITFSWIALNLVIIIYHLKQKTFPLFYILIREKILKINISLKHIILLVCFILIFILLLVQGIIYPPNNWDSMAYHMPRIINWIAHGSFENFQTHILRQLYQPCFSEYVMMNIQLLTGSDQFNNLAQLFFHLFASFTVVGISKEIGLTKEQQFFGFILAFIIPESLLQASSTQNDIFHGFFLVTSVYFLIRLFKNAEQSNFILLGISVGLAFLSKAISFLYFPITGLFAGAIVLDKYFKTKDNELLKNSLLSLVIFLLINLPHSYRNYQFSGDIRGTSKKESQDYINEELSLPNTISIAVKNIGLHLDPLFIGNTGNVLVEKFHLMTGLDINKKGTNVFNSAFTCDPGWKNHEDTQPNFLHLLMICISSGFIIYLWFRKERTEKNSILLVIIIHALLQFLLFCLMLSWEPWNSRLHIPLFYSVIPVIVVGFNHKKTNIIYYILTFLLIAQAFYVILTNYSREFISIEKQNSIIGIYDSRYKKYFTNRPDLYPEYDNITNKLVSQKTSKIGLIIHNDSWEYPLYPKLNKQIIEPIHLQVNNYTKSISPNKKRPECIVSDVINLSHLTIKNKKYINQYPKNKFIWLYLPENIEK
jgi:hypothetical protein